MDNKYTVYKHTSPSNKVYIGVTSYNPESRWRKGNGYKTNSYFWRAIKKYGWDNISHEILYENLSKQQAENIEILLIKQYNSANHKFGYNIELGGSLSGKMSEETKQKISKSKKGKKASEESKKKMSISRKGEGNAFYGKSHTDESKNKIGLSNSQKSWKGKFGKDHNKSKQCLCIETGIIYFSTREAERITGIDHSSINRCCNEKQNQAGGYTWKYLLSADATASFVIFEEGKGKTDEHTFVLN